MKNILILGAGRSSSVLIKYLLEEGNQYGWQITVGDTSLALAKEKIGEFPNGIGVAFDLHNESLKEELISKADLVISLLPPPLHPIVAESCVKHSKHFLTASYVTSEINGLNEKAKSKGILILMEMGLDPGIDHMSAIKEIEAIKEKGGKLLSFKSYTGGLVAPESDDNPWHYKISWNPRNVVLAGQGTVKYLENGTLKYIPYHKLFSRTEKFRIKDFGMFEGYANRDSLKYIELYNLQGISSFIRGTLRREDFCKSWDVFVQLGMTEDTYQIPNSKGMTYREFLYSFMEDVPGKIAEEILANYIACKVSAKEIQNLKWLGLFGDTKIKIENGTPAQILQEIIEDRWKMKDGDKDMVVMQHHFEYEIESKKRKFTSTLVHLGEDSIQTAMAKTVGLPLGMAAKLIMQGQLHITGVHLPIIKEIYDPVLKELEKLGVGFNNEDGSSG